MNSLIAILGVAAVFIVLILLGIPIAYAMISSGIFYELVFDGGIAGLIVPFMQMKKGVTYGMLAIFLFVFLGNILNSSRLSDYIVTLAKKLVPKVPGRTGIVMILSCALMGPLTGSANGCTVSIGSIMYPKMAELGYDKNYSTALLSYSGILGSLVPPSVSGIVYAMSTGTSVMAVWLATLGAGLVYLVLLILVHVFCSKRYGFEISNAVISKTVEEKKEERAYLVKAIPSLLVPICILGGIWGGFATATEAGALGSFAIIFLGVFFYKTIKKSKIVTDAMLLSAQQTANIMLMICTSYVLSYIIASTSTIDRLTLALMGASSNPYILLLLVNIVLLILGCFLDDSPIMILLAPLAYGILTTAGIHPCHLAGSFILTCLVGLITPPVGVVLYSACSVTGQKMNQIIKQVLLFFVPAVVSIILVTFIPAFTTTIPILLGFAS